MIEIAKKPEMKKFQEALKDFINNMDEAFYNKMLAMVENLLKDLN
jgi:soluble cytochrome b562